MAKKKPAAPVAAPSDRKAAKPFMFHLLDAERAEIDAAAARAGFTGTAPWVRKVALEAARRDAGGQS